MSGTVIFAGAGLSSPYGLPVMNSFFQQADISTILSQEEKLYLRKLRAVTRRGMSMIQGTDTNLEHVLSFTSMNRSGEYDDDTTKKIIAKIYQKFKTTNFISLAKEFTEKFVNATDNITFITTNYDIVIESFVSAHYRAPYLPGTWKGTTNGKLYTTKKTPKVQLCKLHGSVNWYLNDGTLNIHDSYGRFLSFEDEENETGPYQIHMPKFLSSQHEISSPPLIVPPTYFKGNTEPIIDAQWDLAHDALVNASKIVVLGYSFPDSDTNLKYFLASALAENFDCERYHLVDLNAREIVDRISDPEKGFGNAFKQKLVPINQDWREVNYNSL